MARRLIALLFAMSLPVAVGATVLVPAEFREIVNGADLIVYARVSATEPRLSGDRKHVDTLVTLQAGTYLKGTPREMLVIVVPGGTVGRYRNVTVGAPSFKVGDEAVFFLRTRGNEMPVIFGLNQGIFRVWTEGATSRRIVTSPVVSRTAGSETVIRGDPARKPLPLEMFGAQVQSVLAEAGRSVR